MDPVKVLYDEHDIIVSAIDAANAARALASSDEERFDKITRSLLGFFRSYADRFHHFKEEQVLFPEMTKRSELLEDGVIKEMLENHDDFRSMMKNIEKLLNEKNYQAAADQLGIYCESLLDHIAVENDEVFQMAETLFSDSELEKIFFRFEDLDRETGQQEKDELVQMIANLNKELSEA